MRSFTRWIGKLIVAGLLALTVLNIFATFYYNFGIRKTNTSGATDYVWENTFYSLATEGFALGFADEDGLNNAFEPKKDVVDILLMGSSQMEGRNVLQDECTAYLLNEKLHQSEADMYVYNLGVEGHDFYHQADNIKKAIDVYEPKSYIIMETRLVSLDENKIRQVLEGTREKDNAYDEGAIYYLQKVPFLRVIHHQLVGLRELQKIDEQVETKDEVYNYEYEILLEQLLSSLSVIASNQGCGLIIFYIPSITIDNNGLEVLQDEEAVQQFENICLKNNIVFVNMSEDFYDAYDENRIIPYGFSNTSIGKGHLNSNGHMLIAERLYEIITDLEMK